MKVTSRLSIIYREDRTRYSMQFLADIMKKLSEDGKITREDLYNLKESDVIEIIENSKYKDIYKIWKETKKVKHSDEEPKNVYYVKHGAKVRYINPLVEEGNIKGRAYDLSESVRKNIDNIYNCLLNFKSIIHTFFLK